MPSCTSCRAPFAQAGIGNESALSDAATADGREVVISRREYCATAPEPRLAGRVNLGHVFGHCPDSFNLDIPQQIDTRKKEVSRSIWQYSARLVPVLNLVNTLRRQRLSSRLSTWRKRNVDTTHTQQQFVSMSFTHSPSLFSLMCGVLFPHHVFSCSP